MYLDICPKQVALSLFRREDIGLNKSTWDKCMNKTPCKIGAIVGIVVVALIVFWIVMTIVRCCCMGLSCIEALCCCCSCCGSRKPRQPRYAEPQLHYNNPNMYPPAQPMRQAEPSYQPVGNHGYEGRQYSRGSYDGYKPLQF